MIQVAVCWNSKGLPIYGTLVGANDYFKFRLDSEDWDCAENDRRIRALSQATRAIDNLTFAGAKTVATQGLEFPRDGETVVPVAVEIACYELAMRYLSGIDPEMEADRLMVRSQGYARVKTDYDRSFIPENVRAGIHSLQAWMYLRPYLADNRRLHIRRGD
jgi:hypothetical protein